LVDASVKESVSLVLALLGRLAEQEPIPPSLTAEDISPDPFGYPLYWKTPASGLFLIHQVEDNCEVAPNTQKFGESALEHPSPIDASSVYESD